MRDRMRGPPSDILIKRCGVPEHDSHVCDLRGIPGTDGLIERGGAIEHPPHVRDLGGIP